MIGISKEKETRPRLTTNQKRRETCILILLLLFSLFFLYLLLLNPLFALLWGFFCILFVVFMALPRDRVPKDLERIRRDIDRRTHFRSFGTGLLHFENGGPTKPKPHEDDY